MKLIEKKIDSTWFHQVATGLKPFEIRKDEDDVQCGDLVLLKECYPASDGTIKTLPVSQLIQVREIWGRDEKIPGLKDGYIIFTFDKLVKEGEDNE